MSSENPTLDQPLSLSLPGLRTFAERHYGGILRSVHCQPLRGGLQAVGVFRVRAHLQDPSGRLRFVQFVVKSMHDEGCRELFLYRALQVSTAARLAPCLLGTTHEATPALLFLEWVQPVQRWPWRDVHTAGLVLARVARLHLEQWAGEPGETLQWNYDDALHGSAEATLETLEHVIGTLGTAPFSGAIPTTRRLIKALPAMRRALLSASPVVWIHGDLHPGNVILRRRGATMEPVFLDWARARPGSPLEDVSTWLQSLGHWEPQARRYHDTLVRMYLTAQGLEPVLARDFRRLYWVAGVCNALAGALRHHLVAVQQAHTPQARALALTLTQKWLRLLRCADTHWRTGYTAVP